MAAMPRILGVSLLLCASIAQAGTDLSCGYSTGYDIDVDGRGVTLERAQARYRLEGDQILRDGRALALSPEQRRLARDYRLGLEALVPEVARLAARGAMLGVESVALTAAVLSGDERDLTRAVERIEAFALRLAQALDGRRLPAGQDRGLSDFDAELGGIAAQAAADLTASVLALTGRALLNPRATAERSEYLSTLVERRVESRARALEAEADRLCARMRGLDILEAQLGVIDVFTAEAGSRAELRL